MRFIPLLLTALFFGAPLQAAPAPDEPAPVFDIELLVFLRDAHGGGERWPEQPGQPDLALAVGTVDGSPLPVLPPEQRNLPGATPVIAASRPETPLATPLPSGSRQLNAHATALQRRGMTPLVHAAWRQAVGDRENRDWLWLEGAPLHGLVRIGLGRYLHVYTDLLLADTAAAAPIRAQDHRRLRSGELHYLDHPAIGVLVRIDRYEPETTEAEPLMLETMTPAADR